MSRYLFITDAPLTDGYRNWFLKELSKVAIQTADVDFLSLVPAANEKGKVPVSLIRKHAPEFYHALEAAEARVVVPLGGEAFRAVTGKTLGIESARGYVYFPQDFSLVTWRVREIVGQYKTGPKKGTPKYGPVAVSKVPELPAEAKVVIPTYSLQYVVKKRKKPMFALVQDLRRAKRAVEGRLNLVDGAFDRDRKFSTKPIIGWVPIGDRLAFDIETPMDARDVRQISFSDGFTTMAMDWNEEVRDYSRQLLGNPRYVKYAHNATFDVPRLRDAGCPVVAPIFDTMLGGQLLQPDLPKALGKMASVYLDAREWKSLSEADPYFYSAKDSFMTARLSMEITHRLNRLGMMPLAQRLMSNLPTLLSMHEDGIRVDLNRVVVWVEKLKKEMEALGAEWLRITQPIALEHGAVSVQPTQTAQLHRLFYKWLKLEPRHSASDGLTLDKEALFDLKALYPEHAHLIETLLAYRKVHKQYSTYAGSLAGLMLEERDRVNPQYLPGGQEGETFGRKGSASTGRLGVSRPNIQNQTPDARRMYIPDTDDHVFIEFDYSQAELRVIAALSGDRALSAALATGDIHSETARNLFGSPDPRLRKIGKNSIYASSYLGGPRSIQTMMKREGMIVPIPEIKRVQAALKGHYTQMFSWLNAVVAEGTAQGYLINPFGRVRFFYGGRDDGPEMADFNPQSTIADIVLKVLRPLDDICREFGGRLVTTVHDSFLCMVLKEYAHIAYPKLKAVLEQPFDEIAPGFVIPVDAKIGTPGLSWGELEKEKVTI